MVLNRNITKREEFELKRHFKKWIVNEINKFYKLTKNSKFLKEEEASSGNIIINGYSELNVTGLVVTLLTFS